MTDLGKIPPQHIDSEEGLLGSLIIDPSIVDVVMGTLQPEFFYKAAHEWIFRAMQELYNKHLLLDMIAINDQLRKTDQLEGVGGAVYIASLTKQVGTGFNYGYYTLSIIDSYVRRSYIELAGKIETASFDESIDIADIITATNNRLTEIQKIFSGIQKAKQVGELANDALQNYFERKKLRSEGLPIGLPTGLNDLTKITGGWQNGDSIILAGRPSMGKTALALHFAAATFNAGKKVQFFSYEMTAVKLADRILVGQSKVPSDAYRYGNLTTEEEQTLEDTIDELQKVGCFIDDNSSQNIDQVIAKMRVAKSKGLCDLGIIDYLGLIPSHEKKGTRELEVAAMSAKVKQAAKELDIPIILVVQVSRAAEQSSDKRPRLSDLRESGAIEQDADVVIFVYRPEVYGIGQIDVTFNETIDSEGMGIAIVAKQRNGPIGDILFQHSHGMNVIKDFKAEGELEFESR
jgi:replicative DNA helicase